MAEIELPAEGSTPSAEDQRALLTSKIAQASQLYAHKAYEQAAETYAEAAEIQAALNGEMALENADLLYLYGRCLYHVAVAHSDVLGGKVAGEKANATQQNRGVKRKKTTDANESDNKPQETNGHTTVEPPAASNNNAPPNKQETSSNSTPYFQIEGDDAGWDSDTDQSNTDEDDAADDTQGQEGDPGTAAEEEDDFATAYEILDVARVLLTRKLEATEQDASASSATSDVRTIKEALADTHDLQSEISLESERFPAAVADSRASLVLKQELYSPESNYIAEAHFKLSLALEFASVTQVKDENDDPSNASAAAGASSKPNAEPVADRNTGVASVDEEMRKEAVTHMEAAIASTKLRLEKEKQNLADMMHKQVEAGLDADAEPQKQERLGKEKDVADVESMIEEMDQRLVDLRQPAVSLNGAGGDEAEAGDAVRGLLGSLLGETKEVRDARIGEATKAANDLSGMVKKKPKASTAGNAAIAAPANGDGKRKSVSDDPPTATDGLSSKRAKTEGGFE